MSFRFKTILGIALIEAITLSLLIYTSLNFLKSSNEKALIERATTTCQMFATMTTDAVLSFDLASLETYIEALLKSPGVVYGRIISESEGLLAEGGNKKALAKPFIADHDFKSLNDKVFDVQSQIVVQEIKYGVVQVGLNVSELQAILGTARYRITILAAMEMILTAFFSLILGLWLTRQLISLAEGSRQISQGNLGYQVPVHGKDELARTAAVFNQMSIDLKHFYEKLHDALSQTQRKSHELALSEAKMRAVLTSAVDGIITITENGIIESYNPAAETIFGYTASEMVGQNVKAIVPEPHKNKHDSYIRNYLTSGIPKIIGIGRETFGKRSDGELFPIELGISEIKIEKERMFTGIIRDITERKAAENELQRYQEKLEQMVEERTIELREAQQQLIGQAFESGRSQMAAMVLHNIGNAITPFETYIETLKVNFSDQAITYMEKCYSALSDNRDHLNTFVIKDPKGKEIFIYLGELINTFKDSHTRHLQTLTKMQDALKYVSDIISIQQPHSTSEKEQLHIAKVNKLVENAIKIQFGAIEKRNIRLSKNLAPGLPDLLLDNNRLMQVLVNLIKNAYEAIDSRNDENIPNEIQINTFSEKERIIIEIIDTGIGIDAEAIPMITNFGKSYKGSSGLGLYYCNMFMANNNGELSIESAGIGKGAKVKLIFKVKSASFE